MRKGGLRREIACHVNITAAYRLSRIRHGFRGVLQVCSIDLKCFYLKMAISEALIIKIHLLIVYTLTFYINDNPSHERTPEACIVRDSSTRSFAKQPVVLFPGFAAYYSNSTAHRRLDYHSTAINHIYVDCERNRREGETVAGITCNAICVVARRYRNFLVYPAEINLINYAVINEILDRER